MSPDSNTTELETIRTAREGPVLQVTLDRPARLNAWNRTMARELYRTIADANDDDEIGAVVLTAAGRAFCAGADVAMLEERRARRVAGEPEEVAHGGMPLGIDWVAFCRQSKPLLAAVNGVAVGIGVTMILPFDVILASDQASFGVGFVKMGLLPELAASHFLVQRMGLGRASEFCLSGDMWSAERAERAGLVDHAVPASQLLEEALGLATRIAANPGPQLRMIKGLLGDNGTEVDLELVQQREDTVNRTRCVNSVEHRDAVAAFLARRKSSPVNG